MRTVVTINSQFGAGGHEVGRRLAYALGSTYYDKNLIPIIAKETGLHPYYIEKNQEAPMIRYWGVGCNQLFGWPQSNPKEQLQIAQANIIKRIGAKEDCIIMGRCANYLLYDTAFKVFIYSSDFNARVKRYKEEDSLNQEKTDKQIAKYLKAMDKQRNKYYSDYTVQKWLGMTNYNICIDTARVDLDRCVAVIRKAIHG